MFQKDFILNRAKNGWVNFLSNIVPKTNNNLEGYNKPSNKQLQIIKIRVSLLSINERRAHFKVTGIKQDHAFSKRTIL